MRIKLISRFISVLLLLLCMQSLLAASTKVDAQSQFLSLTDIHFNPYDTCANATPCPLVEELRQASVEQWEAILAKYQTTFVSYGADTNYPLLKSALAEAGKQADLHKVNFVVVLGDYLSHDYNQNFNLYSSDKTQASYQSFVKKSISFVAAQLAGTFPKQNIFMAIGNNDSYVDDYVSEPHGQFYQDMADIESGLIKDKAAQAKMLQELPIGGYYSINLHKQPNLRLIVLNTVLFSAKAQGDNVDIAAMQELNWFHDQLAIAYARHQKVLITLHIPASVDVYSTLKKTPYTVIELWKPEYTQRYQDELKVYSSDIVGVISGHSHMDFMQVLNNGYNQPIPVSGTPAISPLFGNNPGFKLYVYSPISLKITDFTVYIYSLKDQAGWTEEYNFNHIYQPDCHDCSLIDGMSLLNPTGELADHYINYFATGMNSQPISKTQKWLPFYWCAIHNMTAIDYQNCVNTTPNWVT
ncbi:MAG: metallophosphoesterase [Gammaproteobacteria bacterium]